MSTKMKKVYLIFVTLVLCFPLYPQDKVAEERKLKKAGSRLAFIASEFESGSYEEAANDAKKLVKGLGTENEVLLPARVEGYLWQARAYDAVFCFRNAEEAYKEAEGLAGQCRSKDIQLPVYVFLAEYLQETGDLVRASAWADKALALQGLTTLQRHQAELVRAKILHGMGFLNDALTLLEQQADYRLRAASAAVVDEQDRISIHEKPDFLARKTAYSELLSLRSACLLEKGQYQEAEKEIRNSQAWVREHLGKHHALYRTALEQEAELARLKNNPGKAASLYADAYNSQDCPEHQQYKIHNLSRLIITSIESGQVIWVNNYLRRLQMYAFQNVGSDDPFQVAYEYVQAYKSCEEGSFTSAIERLQKLSGTFAFLPPHHYWNDLLSGLLAKAALKNGNITLYREVLDRRIAAREKYSGTMSPAFHTAMLASAIFEIKYGKDFSKAETIMKNSYDGVVKKETGAAGRDNVSYLTAYAGLYARKDRYDSSALKAGEAAETAASVFGEKSGEYLLLLTQLAEYQILSGAYKQGFENLQKAQALVGEVRNADPDLLQNTLFILSRLNRLTGEYEKSQLLLAQANRLGFSTYEKQALTEGDRAEQLGSLYLLSGNYYKAEKSFKQAFALREQSLGEEHPVMIRLCQELARLYVTTGNYNGADLYLKKSMHIAESVLGKRSLAYAEGLLVSADYYASIGDYTKAEDACVIADEIETGKLGKANLKHAEILTELAFIRYKKGTCKSSDIESLYKEAGNVIKNSLGMDNPLSAMLLQKQAELYIGSGKPEKAEPLLAEAEKYWDTRLGADNQYGAQIQLLRGDISYTAGKYDVAEKKYKKAQQLYGEVFNEHHPGYLQASGKLARVYYMQGDAEKSLSAMEQIMPEYLGYVSTYFPSLSFREKNKFWNKMKDEFEFYNFLALQSYSRHPQLASRVYNNLISTKALLLSSDIKIRERILESRDSLLIDYYNQWQAQKEYLTTSLALTRQQLAEQHIDLREVEAGIEHLEKEISKRSEAFSGEEKKRKATWKDIKETLKDQEYAVEIVRYRFFDKAFTDSVLYATLIINGKSETPEVVILPNGKQMEKKYLKLYRNAAIYKVPDRTSYQAYWEPVGARIPEGITVFWSGDGVYNQINVEMLSDATGKFILDRNQVVLVSNTKDLLNAPSSTGGRGVSGERKGNTNTYVLCGNPTLYAASRDASPVFSSLPGAEQEVNDIYKILLANGKQTLKFLNDQVKEDTLKKLESPAVFHIASHGYFKEKKEVTEEDFASNPLLNSGLMLCGSGDILGNKENDYVNQKEGILTAYEASSLNFFRTDLVVLSACETGRGEVQVGEGVYGLQRAFLIAGADAVIMSLFKVNDEVTQKLMSSFYTRWLKTGDKRQSFIEAKREIRLEYNAPLYWGAFIMIEGKPGRSVSAKGEKVAKLK